MRCDIFAISKILVCAALSRCTLGKRNRAVLYVLGAGEGQKKCRVSGLSVTGELVVKPFQIPALVLCTERHHWYNENKQTGTSKQSLSRQAFFQIVHVVHTHWGCSREGQSGVITADTQAEHQPQMNKSAGWQQALNSFFQKLKAFWSKTWLFLGIRVIFLSRVI